MNNPGFRPSVATGEKKGGNSGSLVDHIIKYVQEN